MDTNLRRLVPAIFVFAAAACNTGSPLDVGMDTEGAGGDGPTLAMWNSALTVSDATFDKSSDFGVDWLGVTVTLSNTGTEVLRASVAQCDQYAGIYDTPERDRRVAVLGGNSCTQEGPTPFEIAPGGSARFAASGLVTELLDGHAAGTYYVTFWMELADWMEQSDPVMRTREYVVGEVKLP